eukprot:scaffold1140_cov251-Pinguiococcus_pyrenoidosus.AAC.13
MKWRETRAALLTSFEVVLTCFKRIKTQTIGATRTLAWANGALPAMRPPMVRREIPLEGSIGWIRTKVESDRMFGGARGAWVAHDGSRARSSNFHLPPLVRQVRRRAWIVDAYRAWECSCVGSNAKQELRDARGAHGCVEVPCIACDCQRPSNSRLQKGRRCSQGGMAFHRRRMEGKAASATTGGNRYADR